MLEILKKPFNCVQKMSSNYKSYSIHMYKQDLALNNLQWLLWHKPNQQS